MNNTELDQQFRSEAADAPDSGAVRDAVIRGVALRGRRRRRVALVSSVMAVVLTVGGIGVASRIGQAAPHPAAPAWPVDRPVQIPAGSTAVPFTTSLPATSPITATVDAPADSDTIVWSFDVSTLQVAWTNPNAAGVSTEVPPSGASATPAELIQRGYLISATAGLTVSSVAADGTERDRLAPLTAPREVMVAGHRATIGGDPDPTQSRSFFGPVARWLVWQLPDGRVPFCSRWPNAPCTPTASLPARTENACAPATRTPRDIYRSVTGTLAIMLRRSGCCDLDGGQPAWTLAGFFQGRSLGLPRSG